MKASMLESFLEWKHCESFLLAACAVDLAMLFVVLSFQAHVFIVLNFVGMTCIYTFQGLKCSMYHVDKEQRGSEAPVFDVKDGMIARRDRAINAQDKRLAEKRKKTEQLEAEVKVLNAELDHRDPAKAPHGIVPVPDAVQPARNWREIVVYDPRVWDSSLGSSKYEKYEALWNRNVGAEAEVERLAFLKNEFAETIETLRVERNDAETQIAFNEVIGELVMQNAMAEIEQFTKDCAELESLLMQHKVIIQELENEFVIDVDIKKSKRVGLTYTPRKDASPPVDVYCRDCQTGDYDFSMQSCKRGFVLKYGPISDQPCHKETPALCKPCSHQLGDDACCGCKNDPYKKPPAPRPDDAAHEDYARDVRKELEDYNDNDTPDPNDIIDPTDEEDEPPAPKSTARLAKPGEQPGPGEKLMRYDPDDNKFVDEPPAPNAPQPETVRVAGGCEGAKTTGLGHGKAGDLPEYSDIIAMIPSDKWTIKKYIDGLLDKINDLKGIPAPNFDPGSPVGQKQLDLGDDVPETMAELLKSDDEQKKRITTNPMEDTPAPCSHCGGTGRAPDANDDYQYPRCRGTGEQPAPKPSGRETKEDSNEAVTDGHTYTSGTRNDGGNAGDPLTNEYYCENCGFWAQDDDSWPLTCPICNEPLQKKQMPKKTVPREKPANQGEG